MEIPFDRFYKENIGLVHKVARKVHARLHAMGAAVPYDDVFQEATVVMIRAYEKFDPSLGFKFSTYYVKAAYYELNNFVKSYEQDCNVLQVCSLQGACDDNGDTIDMESTIDGGHGSPEQMLEAKELLEEIEEKLSPMANKIMKILVDPPDLIMQEWESLKALSGGRSEMTIGFVVKYLSRLMPVSKVEIRAAGSEISGLQSLIHY